MNSFQSLQTRRQWSWSSKSRREKTYSAQWSMLRQRNSSMKSSLLDSYLVSGHTNTEGSLMILFSLKVTRQNISNCLTWTSQSCYPTWTASDICWLWCDIRYETCSSRLSSVPPEYPQDGVPLHDVAVRAQQDLGLVLVSGHLTMGYCSSSWSHCSLHGKNIGPLPDPSIGQNNVTCSAHWPRIGWMPTTWK